MGTEEVASVEESNQISEVEQKIIRQIEYYFGNFNLTKDKFLREQIKLDDGWVPLDTMILFKRLKSITEDYKVICEALKKSPSELMEVDEEAMKIRRRVEKPLPDDDAASRDVLDERTIYVKGFKKTATLDELLEFFKEHKAEHISMRRNKLQKNNPFKGSCFIMFETKEDAEKFLANKEIKYENTELLKETKKDYMKRKDEFYENLKAEKEKKRAAKGENKSSNEGNKPSIEESKDNKNKDTLVPGCLIKICGLGKDCSREDIKEVFEKYGTVVFVDYSRGNPEAVLRYESGIAASVLEDMPEEDGEKKVEIASSKATLSLVEGDSEKEYWKNIAVNRAKSRNFYSHKPGRGGRFNKGNRNWGRGKRNQRDGDSGDHQPFKKQKLDTEQIDKPSEEANGSKNEPKMDQE